ncbi:hypothetical protein ACOJR9_11240 [Alteromonas sp. A081]|uniref:hypothetical protein n=1 Tax=Alteromonas sp. A081 TaxID=3410269 RepID=UPI003B984B86
MMKTLTSIILLSSCLAAVLFSHSLAAAEEAKQQPIFNGSMQAQPIFNGSMQAQPVLKKVRRISNTITSGLSQRIITPQSSKTSLKQPYLIHTAMPHGLSQSE